MGSGGSKASPSSAGKKRSKGKSKVFQSCLGRPSGSRDSNADEQVKIEVKVEESDEIRACVSSIAELDGWHQASRAGSSSVSNAPSRFLSRFSLNPSNLSFRLSRASSLGSSRSRAHPVSPRSHSVLDDENENEIRSIHSGRNLGDGIVTQQAEDLPELLDDSLQANLSVSSANEVAGTGSGTEMGIGDCIEDRLVDRRIGAREPVERNVHFSRTLSVGRLRDRVLRRSSVSDCPIQHESEVGNASEPSDMLSLGGETRVSAALPPSPPPAASSAFSSIFNFSNPEMETSRSREGRYHDLLEHRSTFLERRRRIRSQVRALQRLGSRFENLSGHERSCILSGHHRNGRCACRVNSRDSNSNDDTGARASISRIVMLAEALFEVLDEIHQQSVVLSSRPSVSSIGSVPAPNEVVESLPVKIYSKSHKLQNDDAAQCYICLVEYEDEDSLRILPCSHDFHKPCIDKWLKEIHRVCPLCRGDICRSDPLPAET